MMDKKRFRVHTIILTFILLFSSFLPQLSGSASAATPKLDIIRVALFIQTRDITPTVTLSAPVQGDLGIRTSQGTRNWLTFGSGQSVRFSLDQFRIVLSETTDLNAAKAFQGKAAAAMGAREQLFILGQARKDTYVYQIIAGNYTTMEEAATAKTRLESSATIAPLLNGFKPIVKGPQHLGAGTFATEQEALAMAKRYTDLAVPATIVYHENDQLQLVYSVWIGEEGTAEQLKELQQQVTAVVPDAQLAPVTAQSAYLYKRIDHTGNDSIEHYYFNSLNQKLWYNSVEPGIKVHERSGRTYRGGMELTAFNGKLAVINELPFEQYLYAVVSNEMGGGWPAEALKAQAVAARTYALQQGMKYTIAHISDTTYDQAYYGYGTENADSRNAVDATASEVIMDKNGLITPFYSSNAGGFTSETDEVWGTSVSYIHSVPSPDDSAEKNQPNWYRVVTPKGNVGYIREDLVTSVNQKTSLGLDIVQILDANTNIRPAPYVDNVANAAIEQLNAGDRVTVIERVKQSNPFSWIRGPWKAADLAQVINRTARTPLQGELTSLEITKRGVSNRVIEVKANGNQLISVSTPDSFRSVFNGLLSTRFDIDQTNQYTVLSANGTTRNYPQSQGELYVLSGNGGNTSKLTSNNIFLVNERNQVRAGTLDTQFRFIGRGFGHGLGMSQYGAGELARVGYDYKKILQYYYKDVSVVKG